MLIFPFNWYLSLKAVRQTCQTGENTIMWLSWHLHGDSDKSSVQNSPWESRQAGGHPLGFHVTDPHQAQLGLATPPHINQQQAWGAHGWCQVYDCRVSNPVHLVTLRSHFLSSWIYLSMKEQLALKASIYSHCHFWWNLGKEVSSLGFQRLAVIVWDHSPLLGGCPLYWTQVSSIPVLYPLEVNSSPQLWQ